jgi:phosphoribosyl 1,2-cyclic phosphodiesterase
MRLAPIASGSSGNCIYVGNSNTHLIIDAGISGKRIVEGLNAIDIGVQDLNGILVTHEHSDHISALGIMSRKCHVPIYATRETIEVMKKMSNLGKMDDTLYREIKPDQSFYIDNLEITPIHISHDAANPVAYQVTEGLKKLAVVTDLGCYDKYTVSMLKEMDVLMIEANHNVNMLQVGPYPYYLKQRILGKLGHLSNEMCGQLINEVLHDGLQEIILGHLSKENNHEEVAYETVRMEVDMCDHKYKSDDFKITVAKKTTNTEVVEI